MFISCGKLTKKCWLFLFVPVAYILQSLITSNSPNTNIFFILNCKFLARAINFIPWMLIKNSFLSESSHFFTLSKNVNLSQIELNQQEIEKEERKKKIKNTLFLISMGLMDFFASFFNLIISNTIIYKSRTMNIMSNSLSVRIFAIIILSYMILKSTKLYKHHIFSFIIILTVTVLMNVKLVIESYNTNENLNLKKCLANLFISILPEIFYALRYVLGAKYLMVTQGNIYKLLFSNGVIGLILSLIFQIILLFVNCEKYKDDFIETKIHSKNQPFCKGTNFRTILTDFDWTYSRNYLFTLIITIFSYLNITSIWLLILNFSVNHFAAVYSIPIFYKFFKLYIDETKNVDPIDTIIYVIASFIIVLMTFVYTEIIIFRCCGLEKNTNIEIGRRSVMDIMETENADNLLPGTGSCYSINTEFELSTI